MINGLQLTIPGEEVRRLLEQRLEDDRQRADWWKRELTKDDFRIDEATGRDVFGRVLQSLMQRRSVFIVEPVSRIKRQEFDLGSFRQISGLIDHKPTGLHSALECHAFTVTPQDAVQQGARCLADMAPKSLPGCYPS